MFAAILGKHARNFVARFIDRKHAENTFVERQKCEALQLI